MSDPLDDVYGKYLRPESSVPSVESEIMARASTANCPICDSENVDRSRGYRGEYRCLDCGHEWQVGGKDAKN